MSVSMFVKKGTWTRSREQRQWIPCLTQLLFSVPPKVMRLTSTDVTSSKVSEHSNGQNVTFREGQVLSITCLVKGSHPAPEVKVMSGCQDLTGYFTTKRALQRTGDVEGLQEMEYNVELTTERLTMGRQMDNTQLQCVASVPDSGLLTVSLAINVSIRDKSTSTGR